MVREADSSQGTQGMHPELVPSSIPARAWESLGTDERCGEEASVSSFQLFHTCPGDLRHGVQDKFVHLPENPSLVCPKYSVVPKTAQTLELKCRGDTKMFRSLSGLLATNSFTFLLLNVFHALWEVYYGVGRLPRPLETQSISDRDALSRRLARNCHPVFTKVRREFCT